MKRLKNIAALLVALSITVTAASCGGGDAKDNNASAGGDKTATTETKTETKTEDKTEDNASDSGSTVSQPDGGDNGGPDGGEPTDSPVVDEHHFYDDFEVKDQGGRTIVFATYWADWMKGLTMPDYPEDDAENYDQAVMRYNNARRVEEKYNVKFESLNIAFDDIAEQLTTTVLASTPFADVLSLEEEKLITVLSNNFAMPTSDYMTAKSDAFNQQLVTQPGYELLGDTYYFMDKQRPGASYNTAFMGVNQNIIASIGAPNPVDLFDEGKWTWDNWLEIAKMAYKDTDGDGNIDQWGFSGPYGWPMLAWVNSNDAVIFDAAEWKVKLDTPAAMEALNFIEKFTNQEHLWYFGEDFFAWSAMQNAYKDGRIATFYAEPWIVQSFMNEGATFDFSAVPFPTGPSNTSGQGHYYIKAKGQVIPRGVKDPATVYQIYEELMDWFGNDTSYVETESSMQGLINCFQTYEDFDRVMDLERDGGVLDLAWTLLVSPLGNLFAAIVQGEATPAQQVESDLASMQERADDYIEVE